MVVLAASARCTSASEPTLSGWHLSETALERAFGVSPPRVCQGEDMAMNGVIYLVGLIVIILAILSLLGLR